MKKTPPAAILTVLLAPLAGCSPSTDGIDPAALLEERCGSCHSVSIPKNARKSRSDWDETVTRMVNKGARLSPAEKKALVGHLARLYRP